MMKAVLALALLALVGGAAAQTNKPLVDALKGNAQLAELVGVVTTVAEKVPDIIDTLNSFEGTVFAPNNAAFKAALEAAAASDVELDADTLKEILEYHLVAGEAVKSGELTDGMELTTVQGEPLTVAFKDGEAMIEGVGSSAKVVKADIGVGKKVVVHIIDNVLLPEKLPEPTPEEPADDDEDQTLVDVISNNANLTMLATALGTLPESIVETLLNGTFTVFAPTDDAFDVLVASLGGALPDKDTIEAVLTYHVVEGAVKAADLEDGQEITTLNGQTLIVKIDDDGVHIVDAEGNEANVVKADVAAGDSVVHVIDAVLLPVLGEAPAPAPAPSGAASTLAGVATLAATLLAAVLLA